MALSLVLAGMVVAATAEKPVLENPGFETWVATKPGAAGWEIGPPVEVPAGWALNTAYPGRIGRGGAHDGAASVRLQGLPRKQAHLYQMCRGLEAGHWYRVSLWVRGGPISVCCYEYGKTSFLGSPSVVQATAGSEQWRQLIGYYRPPTQGYVRSALALGAYSEQAVEVDDVKIEPVGQSPAAAAAPPLQWETDHLRLLVSASGTLVEFRDRHRNVDYAAGGGALPMFNVTRGGIVTPVARVQQKGDRLELQFLDPQVRAELRLRRHPRHLALEVVSVEPADVDQLWIDLTVRKLARLGGAFNATYDDQFGVSLLGTSVNTMNHPLGGGEATRLVAGNIAKRPILGSTFAIVGAPAKEFPAAIMEAERAAGLPCPMLGGRWARDSEAVRRSYFFATDASEANIDRLIEYAKVGNFGLILLLKDNWLASHGHYQVNRRNFPEGIASLRRTVDKIHAAGLPAGVHAFGPSISPNDAYVTPQPDDRLAAIDLPALGAAVDAKATELLLRGAVKDLPPLPRSISTPGNFIRVGDELVRYREIDTSDFHAPAKLVGCQRGALGTKAASHSAGASVQHLITLWGYFLVDPESTLADELVRNFGRVFNGADFDMVYFDASDGVPAYLNRDYYLNKLHLGFYRQFQKDVLYQTSNGTGTNLCWHLIPRSASADGHGDLKGYLDQRWPGILGMMFNWTRPDVGWYYMFDDVRTDQIEYVAAKVLGIDGSISIETSQAALEKHPYARRMLEMLARYEKARLARHFLATILEQLRRPGHDFRLWGDSPQTWRIAEANYERPRVIESLDGRQNVWEIDNPSPNPCPLSVEITTGRRAVAPSAYEAKGGVLVDALSDPAAFRLEPESPVDRMLGGKPEWRTAMGRASQGVSFSLKGLSEPAPAGSGCLEWKATNRGDHGAWAAIGRRFGQPLDLSGQKACGVWICGDGFGEQIVVTLVDSRGRAARGSIPIGFHGWRLCTWALPDARAFEAAKTEFLILRLERLSPGMSVDLKLAGIKALPRLEPAGPLREPALAVNGRKVVFPMEMAATQGLTADAFEGARFWPGGMQPAQRLKVAAEGLMLQPGKNRVVFTAEEARYPGDVTVILARLRMLE